MTGFRGVRAANLSKVAASVMTMLGLSTSIIAVVGLANIVCAYQSHVRHEGTYACGSLPAKKVWAQLSTAPTLSLLMPPPCLSWQHAHLRNQ